MAVMNIIAKLDGEELARLNKTVPPFAAGDMVTVRVHVADGAARRIQNFSGMVVARRGRGIHSSFIVRRISSGEYMERTFQTYSPAVAGVEVERHGDVRRAKLYYLRERSGKSARIREKLGRKKTVKPR